MLLPLSLICNLKRARRDGTSLIFIQYCYSQASKPLLNTEIAIPAEFFNKKKQCISPSLPQEYGNVEELNSRLQTMFRNVEDIIQHADKAGIEDIGTYVKNTFTPYFNSASLTDTVTEQPPIAPRKKLPDVFDEIDAYIISKEKKVCEKALATFRSMKMHLQAFEAFSRKKITFKSFDYDFYQNFTDFLSFSYLVPRKKVPVYGLKANSVGKTIKQLRIFIRDRVKRKIIPPIDLSDFKIMDVEPDTIYLDFKEISRIYQTDLRQHPHLMPYRDLFVLACLTGLRFSDFSSLRPEDLRNGMLYKKQNKSDHWVVIPMRKEAKAIFTNHFSDSLAVLTNPEFNRHIKTVGKLAGITEAITFRYRKGNKDIEETRPKHDWVTSHTARRSFCTNEFLAGTPVKLIMQISGHKNEKDFYRYVRLSPLQAAKKMEELWLKRDNMQALAEAS